MENPSPEKLQPGQIELASPSQPYVLLRKVFFVVVIIIFLAGLMYLIYQNGKSIYANGI